MEIEIDNFIDDPVLREDIEWLAERVDISALRGSAVFVSGATGFIGSLVVKLLAYLNRVHNARIHISALIRSEEKARRVLGAAAQDVRFITGDITEHLAFDGPADYIIHGASETASRVFVERPVETIVTAVEGTRRILELARVKQPRAVVYLSSMEVFGVTDERLQSVSESDYGYVDILNPRSCYPEGKRLCECLCASYAAEYSVPVRIARLTQTLGAGIAYNDTHVTAQFARSVIEGRDIVLKTEGKTRRPVVYARDALAGIFTVLFRGENGQAYTLANADTTATIRETAEMIARDIAGDAIKVVFDINVPAEYAPNLNLNLNLKRVESLGWRAEVGLAEAYRRMIASMRHAALIPQGGDYI